MKDVMTTGDVARFLGVGQQTVIRWINNGMLIGWLIPGSSHRRVYRSDLMEFMEKNGIPQRAEPEDEHPVQPSGPQGNGRATKAVRKSDDGGKEVRARVSKGKVP
jgi:excisionase family DNA binding protein